MLSRVADALFWMSRYIERAEHVSRLLDVCFHQELDFHGVLAGPQELQWRMPDSVVHWTSDWKGLGQSRAGVPVGRCGAPEVQGRWAVLAPLPWRAAGGSNLRGAEAASALAHGSGGADRRQ